MALRSQCGRAGLQLALERQRSCRKNCYDTLFTLLIATRRPGYSCRDFVAGSRPGPPVRSRRRRLPGHPDQSTSATRPSAIDVAFWFMEDARYTTELIRKHQAGVPVRVLMDPRANTDYPLNADAADRAAGRRHPDAQAADQLHPALEDDALRRPERRRVQRRELQRRRLASGDRTRPTRTTPTRRSISPATPAIINSFRDQVRRLTGSNTVDWANYANITGR